MHILRVCVAVSGTYITDATATDTFLFASTTLSHSLFCCYVNTIQILERTLPEVTEFSPAFCFLVNCAHQDFLTALTASVFLLFTVLGATKV